MVEHCIAATMTSKEHTPGRDALMQSKRGDKASLTSKPYGLFPVVKVVGLKRRLQEFLTYPLPSWHRATISGSGATYFFVQWLDEFIFLF